MEKSKNKETYNPLPEYLMIGPSNIHGAGILAKEDIPGEVVIGITHIYDPNFQHNYNLHLQFHRCKNRIVFVNHLF